MIKPPLDGLVLVSTAALILWVLLMLVLAFWMDWNVKSPEWTTTIDIEIAEWDGWPELNDAPAEKEATR